VPSLFRRRRSERAVPGRIDHVANERIIRRHSQIPSQNTVDRLFERRKLATAKIGVKTDYNQGFQMQVTNDHIIYIGKIELYYCFLEKICANVYLRIV
jgi:hypothetical protein